ncbi:MAG: prephenate dehydrogenase/arogenate dehydrogenase family protein [Acidimicrobiales bacterium]
MSDSAAGSGRRANIMGTGLIGGSIGLAMRDAGWFVSAYDSDPETERQAVTIGAADEVGLDPDAALTIVAVPVGTIADLVRQALAKTSGLVTDVGSTKADICTAIDDPRFIGGHPMAGSDQDGIAGARADLFSGAMWVLTPSESTSEEAFATIRGLIRSLGAESIALPPNVHDELVAQVSHVPHLTSAALMNLADSTSVEHRALLRLAASGFRDMTRISAGRPAIWPDICVANREAIVVGLDRLIEALTTTRDLVSDGDRSGLYQLLDTARTARVNLPVGYGQVENASELAVPIPDRPGEIAAIATLAAELDVNILDLEISHSGEGRQGVMMLVVDATKAERLVGGLMARGYRPTLRELD